MKKHLGFACLFAGVVACGGEPEHTPLVGDWKLCEDVACTEFERTAIRLSADATFHQVRIYDDRPACLEADEDERGTWTYDRETFKLTLIAADGDESSGIMIDNGSWATLVDPDRNIDRRALRVDFGEIQSCEATP